MVFIFHIYSFIFYKGNDLFLIIFVLPKQTAIWVRILLLLTT